MAHPASPHARTHARTAPRPPSRPSHARWLARRRAQVKAAFQAQITSADKRDAFEVAKQENLDAREALREALLRAKISKIQRRQQLLQLSDARAMEAEARTKERELRQEANRMQRKLPVA